MICNTHWKTHAHNNQNIFKNHPPGLQESKNNCKSALIKYKCDYRQRMPNHMVSTTVKIWVAITDVFTSNVLSNITGKTLAKVTNTHSSVKHSWTHIQAQTLSNQSACALQIVYLKSKWSSAFFLIAIFFSSYGRTVWERFFFHFQLSLFW